MKWLLNRLFKSFDFLPNIFNTKFNKTVVILYKTYPFFNPKWRWWSHTNNWEIDQIVKIFNKKKYNVYLIDRSFKDFEKLSVCLNPDIFIGLNGCASGRNFFPLMNHLKPNFKIMITTIEHPAIQRKKYLECYSLFESKTGLNLKSKRLIPKNEIEQYMESINKVDAFFSIASSYTLNEYLSTDKPLYKWTPAIYNKLNFLERDFSQKRKRYLFICGSGLVEKGLDSCLDFFIENDMQLDICAPERGYEDFWNHYSSKLENNIIRHGFVDIKSRAFKRIAANCHFVISNSHSEGFNTAISTAMRTGLIPILTKSTGHKIGNFGILIGDTSKIALEDAIKSAEKLTHNQLQLMSEESYKESLKYSHEEFSSSFLSCLSSFEDEFKV